MKNVNSESTMQGAGILMIIGGIIAGITGIASVINAASASVGAQTSTLFAAACLTFACGLIAMISGVIGVNHSKNHEKAGLCMLWGAVTIALSLGGTILSAVGGQSFSVVNLVFGILLPTLYILAATNNRTESKDPAMQNG